MTCAASWHRVRVEHRARAAGPASVVDRCRRSRHRGRGFTRLEVELPVRRDRDPANGALLLRVERRLDAGRAEAVRARRARQLLDRVPADGAAQRLGHQTVESACRHATGQARDASCFFILCLQPWPMADVVAKGGV
eukprot:2741719-Prymnesium_polylepis.1